MKTDFQHRHLLSIGECMVEFAPNGAGGYAMNFAGDTFNAAWYARRLLPGGFEVSYLTAVGRDDISAEMLAFMRDQGIDTSFVARDDERTVGLYVVQLQDGEPRFTYWRDRSAARRLAHDAAALSGLSAEMVIHFSGITLAILPPENRQRLLDSLAARAGGATISFDTNMRPRLWRGNAELRYWTMRAADVADIVLPSFGEESQAFGDAHPEDTAERYAAAGAATVVVKNGAGPVLAVDGPVRLRLNPVPAVPVDSTAAGDSFAGAFLAALMQGKALDNAVRDAMSVAARVVQSRGALVPVGVD